ncbi:MAG: hypothetical protein AAGC60_06820 [Acidobacteriota bacterium]
MAPLRRLVQLADGRRVWLPLALALGLHRLLLYWLYGDALRALVAANPDRLLAQFLDRQALTWLPWRSLLHLQQTPPLPNALLAGLLAVFEWPMPVTWALLALQMVITLCVALLLARLAGRVTHPVVGLGLGLLWILSPDVVVLESHSFGQLVHETLATLLLLLALRELLRLGASKSDDGARSDLASAARLGVLAGLLALTRASYAYVALPLALLVALFTGAGDSADRLRARRRAVLAFVLPWALLQGGWALKTLVVEGDWRLAPSTWAGGNAAAGMRAVGYGEELLRSIEASEDLPPWFGRFARATDGMPWAGGWGEAEALLPAELRRADVERQQRLLGTDRAENGARQRVVADLYLDAWRRFVLTHPDALVHKAHLGYALYWFPIRYHGSQEVGLFSVEWRIERSLRWGRSSGLLLSGELPEPHLVTVGTWPDLERRPARLWTLDLPVTVLWLLALPALHLGVPLLLVGLGRRLVRTRRLPRAPRDVLLVAATVLYGYAAVVHSLVDQGENMRFRITAEPLIWLLVVLVGAAVVSWLRDLAASPRGRVAARRTGSGDGGR